MEDVIHWVTEHKDESPPKRKVNHSHPDPTANEAERRWCRYEVHSTRLSAFLHRVYQNSSNRSPVSGYGLGLRKDRHHTVSHQRLDAEHL
nr:MAG TPA: hypothetical protein [Bacteriophage sp.]